MNQLTMPSWRRSSRCGTSSCVEVAKVEDQYLVRDSKNPDAAALEFTTDEWDAFLGGVVNGEFGLTARSWAPAAFSWIGGALCLAGAALLAAAAARH
ncbi:DUF397 domain-containing protein [Micromonosporaceae bacterium Da 78-11]